MPSGLVNELRVVCTRHSLDPALSFPLPLPQIHLSDMVFRLLWPRLGERGTTAVSSVSEKLSTMISSMGPYN